MLAPSASVNQLNQSVVTGQAKESISGSFSVRSPIREALVGPLAGMAAYRQFILYKIVPSASRPGKSDKFPCDLTGKVVSAHDPQYWMEASQACSVAEMYGMGWGVGFVFTEQDPFFFLDIDSCLVNGEWSQIAVDLCTLFAGCCVEVSQSGTGLHIFGRGKPPAHSCRNQALGLEFYSFGRFVALTGSRAAGNCMTGASAVLPAFVAQYFASTASVGDEPSVWTEGHELGWELPDDAELIRRAMSFKSAGAAFGGKASFADLFTANEPALAQSYPSVNGSSYNASDADFALAGWFAWLTGNDCPRIERMMRQSGLMRDKWDDHRTYLRGFTIPRALVKSGEFYDPKYRENQALALSPLSQAVRSDEDNERRQKQIEENILIGQGVSSEDCPTSPGITLDEMLVNFCKIKKGKRVVDFRNPRSIFSFDEWKSSLKQSFTFKEVKGDPYHDAATGGMKKKAYETLEVWNAHPGRKEAETVTFRPGYGDVTIDPQFKSAANTWRPIERNMPASAPSLFLDHVDYMFGPDAPRFLDWLAHIEQHPGVLPHQAWVHISIYQGTGRNWLASVLCRVWRGYTAPGFDLADTLRNGFNEELSQKLLVVVDEINEGGSNARWDNAEKLKSLITTETRAINEKYGHKALEWNCARWLILSNHMSALPLTDRDRRFNVIKNELPPQPPEYYEQLYAALKNPGFIAGVAQMLRERDIRGFNPGAPALMNEAKQDMVAASKSETDDIISSLIETHPADVITGRALAELLNNQPFGGQLTAHQRHALDRAGTQAYGKPIWLAGKAVKVRILRNHQVWKSATPQQIQAELMRGSGVLR